MRNTPLLAAAALLLLALSARHASSEVTPSSDNGAEITRTDAPAGQVGLYVQDGNAGFRVEK